MREFLATVEVDSTGAAGLRNHEQVVAGPKYMRIRIVLVGIVDTRLWSEDCAVGGDFSARDQCALFGVGIVFEIHPILALALDDKRIGPEVPFGGLNPAETGAVGCRSRLKEPFAIGANADSPVLHRLASAAFGALLRSGSHIGGRG